MANVTELHAIIRNISKSDQVDAERLARYARLDPRILRPITHRSVAAQQALTMVRELVHEGQKVSPLSLSADQVSCLFRDLHGLGNPEPRALLQRKDEI